MINKRKLLEGLQRQKPTDVLYEESFPALAVASDDKRVAKSKSMIAKYEGMSQDANGHALTTWNVPSQTRGRNYTTHVGIMVEGGLFSIAKGKWKPKEFSNTLANADVKVHCNCPDFYWSGAKFNLGPNGRDPSGDHTYPMSSGYKHEKNVVSHAPDVRDPERRHRLCKHLLAVFNVFKNNAFSIMGDARKFDVEVKPSDVIKTDDGGIPTSAQMETLQSEEKDAMIDEFVTEVDQLHKDQKLPDDESSDMIDTVVSESDRDDEPEVTEEIDIVDDQPDLEKDSGEIDDAQEIMGADTEDELEEPELEVSELDNVEEYSSLEKDSDEVDLDAREMLN